MSTTHGTFIDATGREHCPHCGSFIGDEHACEKTPLHCGNCDERTVIQARKEALAGKTFVCDGCRAINIIPSPGGG